MVLTRFQKREHPMTRKINEHYYYKCSLIRFLCFKHKFIFISSFKSPKLIYSGYKKSPTYLVKVFLNNFNTLYLNDGLCKSVYYNIALVVNELFQHDKCIQLSCPLTTLIVKCILQDGASDKCCEYKHKLPYLKNYEKEKKEKESTKRLARFTTKGWHKTKDQNDPNKKTWDVVFELREIAVSLDETKSKFEILSIVSEEVCKDKFTMWGHKEYAEWFEKKTGGGWLSVDNKELEWITTMSKSEQRDLKLKSLGI